MKVTVEEKRYKAQVVCSPPQGAPGRNRAGRHWAMGATIAVIDEATKKALEEDVIEESIGGGPGKGPEVRQKRPFFHINVIETWMEKVEKEVPDTAEVPRVIQDIPLSAPVEEKYSHLERGLDHFHYRLNQIEAQLRATHTEQESLRTTLKERESEVRILEAKLAQAERDNARLREENAKHLLNKEKAPPAKEEETKESKKASSKETK